MAADTGDKTYRAAAGARINEYGLSALFAFAGVVLLGAAVFAVAPGIGAGRPLSSYACLVLPGLIGIASLLRGIRALSRRVGGKDEVRLTPTRLELDQGPRPTVLALAAISDLYLIRRQQAGRGGPIQWAVLCIHSDRDGDLRLDIASRTRLALFDTRQILQDLLPRLPAAARIDPAVRAFAATGALDLDRLPAA